MKKFARTLIVPMVASLVFSTGGCPGPVPPGGGGADGGGGSVDGQGGSGGGGSSGGGTGGGGTAGGGTGGGGGGGNGGGGAVNGAPSAALSVGPSSTTLAGGALTLDAGGSSDPDGDPLTFTWSQIEGPFGAFTAAGGSSVTYDAPYPIDNSPVRVQVQVSDGRGGVATASATIQVNVAAEFRGDPQSLEPYKDSLTSNEAYHFLRRTEFGASPARVDQVVAQGLVGSIHDVMTIRSVPADVAAFAEEADSDMPRRWLIHMISGPNPFQERMAMFWHDRFATSQRVLVPWEGNLAVTHWEMLRRNAWGNYRQFLVDLTLDPMMLTWLDGANSPKDNPNENYAREFWELFTLGRDVIYNEEDIQEAARAFTGITLLRQSGQDPRPIFDIRNHDEGIKTIFPGRATPANHDYQTVIDLTLAQPEAARYAAQNLFVYLVHDHPSDAVVEELADLLRDSNWELAPVVRKLLQSRAIFSSAARGNQIVSPVEHVVGFARTIGAHFHREDAQGYIFYRLAQELERGGQDLLNPPGVQGWDEGAAWLQDQWVIERIRALGTILDLDHGPTHDARLPYHMLPPRSEWNQREVRDRIITSVAGWFHLDLTVEERAAYIEVLDDDGWRAFHLIDPQYQWYWVWEMIRLVAMDERQMTR